jgi:hypothetical protein
MAQPTTVVTPAYPYVEVEFAVGGRRLLLEVYSPPAACSRPESGSLAALSFLYLL